MRTWLASHEVDVSPRLRLLGAALCFYHYLTWSFWFDRPQLSAAGPANADWVPLWPFERLGWTLFLSQGETRLYLQLLGLTALAGMFWFAQARETLGAMLILAFNCLNKTFFYLHDLGEVANFHHVHLYLCVFYLFARSKLPWFRWGLAMVYWMAALVKLTPSWLQGQYFGSVPAHLPLLASSPEGVTFWSQVLIFQELVGPLLWFSRYGWLRRLSVGTFLLFHLYSGIIVGFWYTALMLPLALGALWPPDEPLRVPFEAPLALFSILLALGAAVPFWIPGDVRLTAEGRYTGLFMFDANRRVTARLEVVKGPQQYVFELEYGWPVRAVLDWTTRIRRVSADGEKQPVPEPVVEDGVTIFNPRLFRRGSSRMFGDPYLYYFWARGVQERYRPDRVSLRMTQQLDGSDHEFVILDLPDFGKLAPVYRPFAHNPWIHP